MWGPRCTTTYTTGVGSLWTGRSQQRGDSLLGVADSSRQTQLGQVVGVEAGDVVLLRGGHGLLCLHDFDGVRDACGEPVLRLAQGALREIATAVRDRDLLVRGGKTENRSANVDVDTAAYVFVFCAPLHVNGFCCSDARLDPT